MITDLVRAEWLKIRTTAVPYALTLAALLLNGLLILGTFVDHGNTAPGLNVSSIPLVLTSADVVPAMAICTPVTVEFWSSAVL